MSQNWIDAYTPHEWAVYEMVVNSPEYTDLMSLTENSGLDCCGAESQYAAEHWDRTGSVDGLFFFDFEEMAMDLDKVYGAGPLGVLTAEWRGHPIGSLIMETYTGMDKTPITFTIGVTKNAA